MLGVGITAVCENFRRISEFYTDYAFIQDVLMRDNIRFARKRMNAAAKHSIKGKTKKANQFKNYVKVRSEAKVSIGRPQKESQEYRDQQGESAKQNSIMYVITNMNSTFHVCIRLCGNLGDRCFTPVINAVLTRDAIQLLKPLQNGTLQ